MNLEIWHVITVYGVICLRALLLTTILRCIYFRISLLLHEALGARRERFTLPVARDQLARPISILCISPFLCRSRGSLRHPIFHKGRVNVGIHLGVLLEALSMSSTVSNLE